MKFANPKKIKDATFQDDRLTLIFYDDTVVFIGDKAEYGVEERYMTTDDSIEYLKDSYFLEVIDKPVNHVDYPVENGYHEEAFLDIITTDGTITFCTHNLHDGNYAGFWTVFDYEGNCYNIHNAEDFIIPEVKKRKIKKNK